MQDTDEVLLGEKRNKRGVNFTKTISKLACSKDKLCELVENAVCGKLVKQNTEQGLLKMHLMTTYSRR